MTINELNVQIDLIDHEIKTLNGKRDSLIEQRRQIKARKFIEDENVTLDQIHIVDGWYGDIWAWADHLRRLTGRKRFAEWCGGIYFTSDLLNGKMPQTPVRIEDLETETSSK